MGIFKETLLQFFDRKQHLAGIAVTVLALLLIYLGVTKRLELADNNLETAANVTVFSLGALQAFVSLMVLLAAVSTVFLFTKLSRKGQVEYYLSKPITRGSFFFSKLFSIYFIYAIALTALCFMVGIELTIEGQSIVDACRAKRVLINCTQERVLRLLPAMTITRAQLDRGMTVLEEALAQAASGAAVAGSNQ